MSEWTKHRRTNTAEMRPYEYGEMLVRVSVNDEDKKNGSPKVGDWIARNPDNHNDQWLISAEYYAKNFEPL